MDQAQHRKGLLITLLGVLVMTPDSLLIYLANVEPFEMVFWRGIFQGIALTLAFVIIFKDQFWAKIFAIGKTGLAVSCAFTVANICFIYSIALMGAANTLISVATTSMWAALFSFIILKERIPKETFFAMIAAFIGIAIVFWGGFQEGNFTDNLYGIAVAIAMALAFTLIRKKSHVDMVPTSALSAFQSAAIAVFFLSHISYEPMQWFYMAVLGFVVIPVSFGLLTIGPRYIPSAEVSLLLLLETVLGPLWVWLGVGVEPHSNELIGGTIVVLTLAAHSLYKINFKKRRT